MTETQTRAQAIETLALAYHKEQEGEYGCPGVQCPAVKKLTAFGLSCADEANRDLLAQLAQEQHARQEVERKLESAYKTVEALDDAGIEAVRVVRAEAESHLSSLQEEIAKVVEEMRQMTAKARLHVPHVVGCNHIDKWADRLARLTPRQREGQ